MKSDAAQAGRLLRFLADRTPTEATATDLPRAAAEFSRRRQPRGLVVVISDLYDWDGYQKGLDMLARGRLLRAGRTALCPGRGEPGTLGEGRTG